MPITLNAVCPECGNAFYLGPAHRKNGVTLCSNECRKHVSVERRFIGKVSKTGADGCWVWMANTFRNGYGGFTLNGKHTLAHRASWVIFNGEIPTGLQVLHKCDNSLCVNPDHLFLGTAADNIYDMVSKGRQRNQFTTVNNHV